MLETRNISVFYGRHRALENVSATVSKGEIVVMLGANGAGKSTLIRAIAGQTRKTEGGTVLMDGADITRLGSSVRRTYDVPVLTPAVCSLTCDTHGAGRSPLALRSRSG